MFGRSGDSVIRNGLIIPRDRQTCWRVTFVAVAVKAIIRTFSGIHKTSCFTYSSKLFPECVTPGGKRVEINFAREQRGGMKRGREGGR